MRTPAKWVRGRPGRVLSAVGYVPYENLVGRAQIIFFSIEEGTHAWEVWTWPFTVRWSRVFSFVR